MRKNFTIIEIVIAIVVVGILVTMGIPLYNNTVENARARTCELNLKTILGAVEAQTLERNSFPATLSEISEKNFEFARQKVLKEEGALRVKLISFFAKLGDKGAAYAQVPNGPWIHKFIYDNETLRCPSAHGANSYGINGSLAGKTYEEYKNEPQGLIVIGDCDNTSFGGTAELASRHKEYSFFRANDYAVTVTKDHRAVKANRGSLAGGGNAPGKPQDNKKDKKDDHHEYDDKSKGKDKGRGK
jgi:type II secretory pathway pseudopilin PulG